VGVELLVVIVTNVLLVSGIVLEKVVDVEMVEMDEIAVAAVVVVDLTHVKFVKKIECQRVREVVRWRRTS
jgi:hypothetical protein